MESRVLEPGLTLLHGTARTLRGFAQESSHEILHDGTNRHVLWCDGDHGFNPYDFAELNMVRGFAADEGAERMLVKRCMTPFQWDSVLTQHLRQKLAQVDTGLAIVLPYDRLFSTDEIADWEAEDYVRYSVRHLRNLARRHRIPILMGIDMTRWRRTHPILAQMAYDAADARWMVQQSAGQWRLTHADGTTLEQGPATVTLRDFMPEQLEPVPVLERQNIRGGPNERTPWKRK